MPDITVIGRYWPGSSPLHRMDARVKLVLLLAFIVGVFIVGDKNFWGLAVCAVFTLGFFALANIPWSAAFKSLAPLAFIVVITVLLNVFFVHDGTVVLSWEFIRITDEGLWKAAFVSCRLLLLLLGMSLLTLTTATLDITDAFERLMSGLARIGLPVHELAMIMGIALRFLPQFISELQTIYRAQISRGATFAAHPFKGGLSTVGSLIIPLFTSAFRHAETLSLAMDARCYHGGPGRTRLQVPHMARRDACATGAMALMLIAAAATNFITR